MKTREKNKILSSKRIIEIKRLSKDILYNSTAQAIYKITQTPHFVIRIFLCVCVVASTAFSSYSVSKSILNYFSFEVNTISRKLFETPVDFPKVTFCNVNQFTTNYALEYLKEASTQNFPNANIFDEDQLKRLNQQDKIDVAYLINLLVSTNLLDSSLPMLNKTKFGHSLDDILLSCYFNNKLCSTRDFSWILDPQYGNCYIFNSGLNMSNQNVDIKKSAISGPLNGLRLTLYLNFHENLTMYNSLTGCSGAIVRIENSSYLNDHDKNRKFEKNLR